MPQPENGQRQGRPRFATPEDERRPASRWHDLRRDQPETVPFPKITGSSPAGFLTAGPEPAGPEFGAELPGHSTLPQVGAPLTAAPRTVLAPRPVRMLEGVGALLSAGVLVLGVLLAALAVLGPVLVKGTGLSTASGPRLDRVLIPIGMGLLGEILHVTRHRRRLTTRILAAAGTVLAALAALWWGWWQ
ncbi:MAG: hypothetical protein ACR2M5_06505 [Nakamurella sp.]